MALEFRRHGFISFLYFVLFSFVYRNPSEDKNFRAGLEFVLRGGAQPEIERDHKAQFARLPLNQRKSTDLPGMGAITILFST